MLIVRLMKRCNNNCIFCMVHDEMQSANEIPIEDLKLKILQQTPGEVLDFFGGEPSLYPNFFDALEYANNHGYQSIVATNGRKFSDRNFTKNVVSLGVSHIRTSLYGSVSEIHDYHTRSNGSFEETISGIRNIIETKMELLVNIVITSKNYEDLSNIVDLLLKLNVTSIKFSSLIKSMNCLDLVPNYVLVRDHLTKAIHRSVDLFKKVEIEKSPLCLVPEYYSLCLLEQEDNELFTRTEKCFNCQAIGICPGVPVEQFILFGHHEDTTIPFQEGQIDFSIFISKVKSIPYDEIRWDS